MDLLQQALLEARDQVAALKASHAELVAAAEGANADDEHDPEGATIAFERQQLAALLVAAEGREAAAAQALVRRAEGGYGACESCGRPIGEERLEARPATTLCVSCAAAAERRR
jgi:RNA polymerase-binding transcription factor DksA